MARRNNNLTIQPLSGAIGASISGIKLDGLTETHFAQIKAAFLQHCVLVFPDQRLSIEAHKDFALRWGEPSVSPFVRYLDDHPYVLPLSNLGKTRTVTENWHYDSSFLAAPPALTILSARTIPVGGDTMWSNQYRAYEQLSAGLKKMLTGVRAEFTGARLAQLARSNESPPSMFHPVVRTHPETERRALFIGRPGDTVPRFENMTPEESRPLLQFLYESSIDPANIYRHHWQKGDVVMWDNRCTMHYAIHDYGTDSRDLHRISIQGSRPR